MTESVEASRVTLKEAEDELDHAFRLAKEDGEPVFETTPEGRGIPGPSRIADAIRESEPEFYGDFEGVDVEPNPGPRFHAEFDRSGPSVAEIQQQRERQKKNEIK